MRKKLHGHQGEILALSPLFVDSPFSGYGPLFLYFPLLCVMSGRKFRPKCLISLLEPIGRTYPSKINCELSTLGHRNILAEFNIYKSKLSLYQASPN